MRVLAIHATYFSAMFMFECLMLNVILLLKTRINGLQLNSFVLKKNRIIVLLESVV